MDRYVGTAAGNRRQEAGVIGPHQVTSSSGINHLRVKRCKARKRRFLSNLGGRQKEGPAEGQRPYGVQGPPYFRKRVAQQLYLKIEVNKSSAQVDGAQQLWKINHRRLQVTRSPEAPRLPFRCPTSRPAACPSRTHNSLGSGSPPWSSAPRCVAACSPPFSETAPISTLCPGDPTTKRWGFVLQSPEKTSE